MRRLLLTVILAASLHGFGQHLSPGSSAPEIRVGNWLKGRPVEKFHRDSIYVVEFWATWCGPCKQSIPHLTRLSKKYPEVNIIGVSIAEANTKNVEPFVEKMGKEMDYTIAIDQQSSDTARAGFMSKNWMEAAGQQTIPVAFVVNKNQIVWIGYPTLLDTVLEAVVNGTWNTRKFASQWKRQNAEEKEFMGMMQQFSAELARLSAAGNKRQFYKIFDSQLRYITSHPRMTTWGMVNEHIWNWLADPAGAALQPGMKDYGFGITWMEKLTARPEGKNPAFFDTLAWCYFHNGEKEKAVATEKIAISMLSAEDPLRQSLEESLQRFSN